MKKFTFIIAFLISISLSGQNSNTDYSLFNPQNMKKQFFISSNSGVFNTPIGIKMGYTCNPGLYLGFRKGKGKIYNSDSDLKTVNSNLYSIVGGINKPLFIRGDFKLFAQLGLGYGQWWDYRWERWTKSGYEIECGLLIQKNKLLINLTGNLLNGHYAYSTGDLCLGLGYAF